MHRRVFLTSLASAALAAPLAATFAPGRALAQARDLRGRSLSVEEVEEFLFLEPAPAAQPAPGATQTPPQTQRPGVIVDITFDINSARIRPEGAMALDRVAQAAARARNAGRRLALEGHTDITGPFDFNMQLSQRRAESVRDYLAARGVDIRRLTAQGCGPTRLLPGLRAEDPRHRRVEIINLG